MVTRSRLSRFGSNPNADKERLKRLGEDIKAGIAKVQKETVDTLKIGAQEMVKEWDKTVTAGRAYEQAHGPAPNVALPAQVEQNVTKETNNFTNSQDYWNIVNSMRDDAKPEPVKKKKIEIPVTTIVVEG